MDIVLKVGGFPCLLGVKLYLSPRGLGDVFYDLVVVGSIFFTKDGPSMSFIALGSMRTLNHDVMSTYK